MPWRVRRLLLLRGFRGVSRDGRGRGRAEVVEAGEDMRNGLIFGLLLQRLGTSVLGEICGMNCIEWSGGAMPRDFRELDKESRTGVSRCMALIRVLSRARRMRL